MKGQTHNVTMKLSADQAQWLDRLTRKAGFPSRAQAAVAIIASQQTPHSPSHIILRRRIIGAIRRIRVPQFDYHRQVRVDLTAWPGDDHARIRLVGASDNYIVVFCLQKIYSVADLKRELLKQVGMLADLAQERVPGFAERAQTKPIILEDLWYR